MMTEPAKKNGKAAFYFIMALFLGCVIAYAGAPFFVKYTSDAAAVQPQEKAE